MREQLRFTVLGPVRAWRGTAEVPLGPPQQRAVMSVLLVRQGSQVPVEELVDAVWGSGVPASATGSVRTYVHRLRRLLERAGTGGTGGTGRTGGTGGAEGADGTDGDAVIRSVGRGYMMETPPEQLDLAAFRARLAEAERARRAGDDKGAAALFRAGLELWQGNALAGIPGAWAETQRVNLGRLRLSAVEARLSVELDLGRHKEAATDLTALVAEHPLDERFREMLMLALYRSGRQAAALESYREARSLLAEELGVDPSPALRTLHERILRADDTLLLPEQPPDRPPAPAVAPAPAPAPRAASAVATAPAPAAPVAAAPPATVPAQLPHSLPAFAGRSAELAQVEALAPADGTGVRDACVIIAIAGTAGVGKTAFAVRCAHRIASRFPGGQIYLNLRGFDSPGPPVTTTRALCTALEALGVPLGNLPQDVDAQAALYRSLLAGRRVLLLLDNARDTEQVRPLLPGTPGSMAIVTSRNQLSGLIVKDGAQHLRLDVLSVPEARDAIVRRIGAARAAAEEQAVDEIIERSARLPLALSLVAARAATRSGFPLAAVAAELRDTPVQLDAFSDADGTLDVRSVFSWSYNALSAGAARLFRLLAAHPGPDFSLPAAVGLAGLAAAEVRRLLAELTEAHLIDEPAPGRYTPHDLLRVYATELLHAHEPEEERRAATHRVLSHYLHTAYAAARLLSPNLPSLALAPLSPGAAPEEVADHQHAMTWFGAEHAVLLTAVEHAERSGFEAHAWQLAWALMEFLQRCGRWDDQAATQRIALDAARRAADREGQAHAHRNLARAFIQTGRFPAAREHLQQALGLFDELGDLIGQARIHGNIALVLTRQGESRQALGHAQTALDHFRTAGDRTGQASALNNVGWMHALLGEHEHALTHCRQALALLRDLGDRTAEAATWDSIGYIQHQLGHYDHAADCYQRALALDRELGDSYNEADTLSHLGDTHLATGNREAARESWLSALAVLDELDPTAADGVRAKLRDLDAPAPRAACVRGESGDSP